jgi:hypothetical protein
MGMGMGMGTEGDGEREREWSTRETSRVFDIDRRKGRRRKESTQDHPRRHGEEHQQVSSAGTALPVSRRQVPNDQHPEPRRRPQQMLLSAEKQAAASRHARRCGCFDSFLLLGCTARGTLRDYFGTPTQHRRCRDTVAADGCTEAMRAHLRPPFLPDFLSIPRARLPKGWVACSVLRALCPCVSLSACSWSRVEAPILCARHTMTTEPCLLRTCASTRTPLDCITRPVKSR